MATTVVTNSGDSQISSSQQLSDRLKLLYPAVCEEETPLPKSWSPKDKFNYIGLSQNNLRVHYKGVGKTHKDAASVRATYAIPASCGIYYFEVKIISKGRDGYMGVGLSAQGVNMNRLPGWDKHTYGYHGDDGHSFCSSGTGQPYGPTFTTGDVVGCCVNLVDNTCFYTKNGVHLGVAFTDLPASLYPTVGLQTPGEVVEANFGQSPFVYDIEDYMREWRQKTRLTIQRFPVTDRKGEWQTALQRIVSTYLVHHGYCSASEAFAKATQQSFDEDLASIKNRQRIQKLVLAGRMGEAIDTAQNLYPGLLERNSNLLFKLKCRQFIEMVNGTDSEVRGAAIRSPRSHHAGGGGSSRSSPASMSPVHHGSCSGAPISHIHVSSGSSSSNVHLSQSHHHHSKSPLLSSSSSSSLSTSSSNTGSTNSIIGSSGGGSGGGGGSRNNSPCRVIPTKSNNQNLANQHVTNNSNNLSPHSINQSDLKSISEEDLNATNIAMNGVRSGLIENDDIEMTDGIIDERAIVNGTSNGECFNGEANSGHTEEMEIDTPSLKRQLCGGSSAAIEKMLQYGRELQSLSQQLKREYGKNDANRRTLQDAFSLLAYADPWSSPVGYQLNPVQREPVCAALNSAILESYGLPKQPPLEVAIAQVKECLQLMSRNSIGSCAFASLTDYIVQH